MLMTMESQTQSQSQSQSQRQTQTKTSKASSRRRSAKNDKLSLDDYIDLLDSHQTHKLTRNRLNQIISMHGFKKMLQAPKKVLIDAVETIDLVDLPRSTLCQSVSTFAILTVEDAVADLNQLNWQECCVTSIHTLSSCKENLPPPDQNLRIANHLQPKSQAKDLKTGGSNEICSPSEASQSEHGRRATKMAPKRKRFNGDALDSASTVDSVSLASC